MATPPSQQNPQGGYQAPGGYAPSGPPGGYYPPPGQYYLPPGQYPAYQGYYPPPGQYVSPPPGQYPPAGPYPPPSGPYPPPAGQYLPPAGQYPPPGGAPPLNGPPPYGSPYPTTTATPAYLAAPGVSEKSGHPQDALVYLGAMIPDPTALPAQRGVQKVPGYDPEEDYDNIDRAIANDKHRAEHEGLKHQLLGDKAKERVLRILAPLNIFQMDALQDYYVMATGKPLSDFLHYYSKGNFGYAIRAISLGPLGLDVDLAQNALGGVGNDETLLIELLLGRPPHEIRLLKTAYHLRYGRHIVDDVKSNLSGKTEKMFTLSLDAQKLVDIPYAPIDKVKVDADIETLHKASKKDDENAFFEVLINRSDGHLAAVIAGYSTHHKKTLSKVIKKTFSGTIKEGLVYIVHGVKPKRDRHGCWRDAKLLQNTMQGLGTNDVRLSYRLIRAHWNPQRLEGVKDAYRRRYGKALETRMQEETNISAGEPYGDLLLMILGSTEAGGSG